MNIEPTGQVKFREVQRFSDFWLWALILVACGYTLYLTISQLFFGIKAGNTIDFPDWAMALIGLTVCIGLPLLLRICSLTTEIREDGVYFKFFPFHLEYRKILFSKIKKFEAITYKPIADYGGWGLRQGRNGFAYNTSGNRGVLFELANGKTIMLGSQDADSFEQALIELDSVR